MNLFQNISIKQKLMGTISALLLLFFVISGYAVYKMKQIGGQLSEVVDVDIPLSTVLTFTEINQLKQAVLFEKALNPLFRDQLSTLIADFDALGKKITSEFEDAQKLLDYELGLVQGEKWDHYSHLDSEVKKIKSEFFSY